MSIVVKGQGKSRTIHLEGAVDITAAAELKAALVKAFQSARSVHLALDGVTELDVTAVQLLWAAAQQARQAGSLFDAISPLSENLLQSLRIDGLEAYLPPQQADKSTGETSCPR